VERKGGSFPRPPSAWPTIGCSPIGGSRSNQEYVRILHLAATTSESEVETALGLLLEAGTLPTFLAVRDLVHLPTMPSIPQLHTPPLDLSPYDQLIPSRRTNG
jgi:hypothetical protein